MKNVTDRLAEALREILTTKPIKNDGAMELYYDEKFSYKVLEEYDEAKQKDIDYKIMNEEERIGAILDALTDLDFYEIKELLDKVVYWCEAALTEQKETIH